MVSAASLKTSTPIAEANSLLALAKAPISLNSPGSALSEGARGHAIAQPHPVTLPGNIAQRDQMVLNWLQVASKVFEPLIIIMKPIPVCYSGADTAGGREFERPRAGGDHPIG